MWLSGLGEEGKKKKKTTKPYVVVVFNTHKSPDKEVEAGRDPERRMTLGGRDISKAFLVCL